MDLECFLGEREGWNKKKKGVVDGCSCDGIIMQEGRFIIRGGDEEKKG
jgi:hypothetical protein